MLNSISLVFLAGFILLSDAFINSGDLLLSYDSCLRAHIPWISICGGSWGLGLKSCLHRGFAFVVADHPWSAVWINTVWIHTRFYLVCFKPNKLCELWHQTCLRMQLWLNPQRETSVFPFYIGLSGKHGFSSWPTEGIILEVFQLQVWFPDPASHLTVPPELRQSP